LHGIVQEEVAVLFGLGSLHFVIIAYLRQYVDEHIPLTENLGVREAH